MLKKWILLGCAFLFVSFPVHGSKKKEKKETQKKIFLTIEKMDLFFLFEPTDGLKKQLSELVPLSKKKKQEWKPPYQTLPAPKQVTIPPFLLEQSHLQRPSAVDKKVQKIHPFRSWGWRYVLYKRKWGRDGWKKQWLGHLFLHQKTMKMHSTKTSFFRMLVQILKKENSELQSIPFPSRFWKIAKRLEKKHGMEVVFQEVPFRPPYWEKLTPFF